MRRGMLLALGMTTLAALWLGPLPEWTTRSFSAHMALHMGLVAVAAPLLGLGIAGSRFDPTRWAPALFPPIPLSLLELVVVWAWHAPALHHLARDETAGFVAEQGGFLAVGLLVWLSAFGGSPVRRQEQAGAGIAALLLTSMHMTLLGALLALAPRSLYLHAAPPPSLSPLADQQLGGAIMLLVGGVSYLAGGLWLTAGLVRSAKPKQGTAA